MIDLRKGDCKEVLKSLPDNSVDSIVTDPPYELGFMGKSWDSTGIANDATMWAECLRVLKPGGHLLAFSGTRTYHRMASAIEDAGFEVRDMIEWVYGSGFPKSLNIGKAVDKLQGNEREIKEERGGAIQKGSVTWNGNDRTEGKGSGFKEKFIDTKGTSEYEGWGTQLKPAHEPICMARKPLSEKSIAENCLKWGTGGINIDESRVGTETISQHGRNSNDNPAQVPQNEYKPDNSWTGRFPANLIHDNSEEVVACFPETKSGKLKSDCYEKDRDNNSIFAGGENFTHKGYDADEGSAARFFKSIIYQAKASKAERNKGCEGLEEKPGGSNAKGYTADVARGLDRNRPVANNHPTVKPVALMEYLITMVTPKGGTVLEPFMGSGTTGIAAVNLNRNFIGIEMDEHYFEIAETRINEAKQTLFASA